jgi:hypothetical protein
MAVVVIGNFLTFIKHDGGNSYWQNFFNDSFVRFDGIDWNLLPFIYQGATKTKNGDNISSQITLPTNQLTLAWSRDAVNNNWVAEVRTYQLTDTYAPITPPRGQEIWLCTGLNYNTQSTHIELSSPLDAIESRVPNLRFTARQVGALPSTGAIRSG